MGSRSPSELDRNQRHALLYWGDDLFKIMYRKYTQYFFEGQSLLLFGKLSYDYENDSCTMDNPIGIVNSDEILEHRALETLRNLLVKEQLWEILDIGFKVAIGCLLVGLTLKGIDRLQ